MRALRALPVLLTCSRISARLEAHRNVRLTARLDQGIPRPAPVLIPAQENQAAVDWEHQTSAAEHLLASMPKAGGAKAKGQLRDTKNKRIRLPPPLDQFNAAERAIAVNAASWLAVVGGTVLWNRGKMSATEGIVRKALIWSIVSATGVQVASNVSWAVSGNLDGASTQGRGASVWAGLRSFRWSYLGVLAVCNLGEFIQGAYLFRLYSQSSAFGMEEISRLFLAGTLSSMVTGLFAGSLLDRYGRRSGCMLWAILNIVQCFLIRSKAFGALVLGRVIAGAGAMFLATAFESWMITEHRSRGYPSYLLADTFRMATWGIGLATIASGFMADASLQWMGMGLLGPYNVAIGVSLISLVLIASLWNENYGDRSASTFRHMKEAFGSIVSDGRLVMMSAVQALFEGVMLAYIVLWVPAIEAAALPDKVSLGMVFSTMMVSICGGSSLFKLMTEGLPVRLAVSPEACLVLATGLSTVALVASWMELSPGKLLAMFLVYEACIGLYLPAIATCRSKYMDDRIRGTVMNLTRVPVYVVAAFLMHGPVASSSVSEDDQGVSPFGILAGLMGVATLIQVLLLQREREMGIAYGGSGAMASLPKERRGREVHAQLQIDGPPGAGGGWSFFTPPEVGETATASSPTTVVAGPPPTAAAAAAAATAASKQGALAGWMMNSSPSRTEWAENTMGAKVPVPSSRVKERVSLGSIDSSPKNPRREIAKANHGKSLRAAFVAMANARQKKERTTYFPTRIPSPAGSSALSPASKPRATSASTKSSSPPARSGLSAKDRMKAKVASALQQVPPNNIGNFTKGAGAQASPPTKPAASFAKSNPTDWPVGAGRGKAAAFVSSVIGGVAATGWFLFCAGASSAASSTRSSTASQEGDGWPNPFGDLQHNAAAAAAATSPHPSWSTSSRVVNGDRDGGGSGWSSKADGVGVEGRGKTNEGVEVEQGGAGSVVGENGGAGDEGEYEAGVWVGWGGGCAF